MGRTEDGGARLELWTPCGCVDYRDSTFLIHDGEEMCSAKLGVAERELEAGGSASGGTRQRGGGVRGTRKRPQQQSSHCAFTVDCHAAAIATRARPAAYLQPLYQVRDVLLSHRSGIAIDVCDGHADLVCCKKGKVNKVIFGDSIKSDLMDRTTLQLSHFDIRTWLTSHSV